MSFDQRTLRKCHVHAFVNGLLHMGCVRMQGMRRGGMRCVGEGMGCVGEAWDALGEAWDAWGWTLQHLKGHVSPPRSWTLQDDTQTPPMWRSPSTDA
ncbi:hypothetical protein Hanom_Chr12g01071011 [Helianthus anomalus]